MKRKYWLSPIGSIKWYGLPRKWHGITPFGESTALSKGWTEHEEEYIPTTCTKYQFLNSLRKNGKELYERFASAYSSNPEFSMFWNSVLDLDRENADFLRFCEELGVSPEQVEAVFSAID